MRQGRKDARSELLAKVATRFVAVAAENQTLDYTSPHQGAAASTVSRSEPAFVIVHQEAKLRFGQRLNLNDLVTWSNALWRSIHCRNVELDFSSVTTMSTLSMLFISHQIRNFSDAHPDIPLHAVRYKHLTYAAHVGFFDRLGADFGKRVGEAPGGPNYLPITTIVTRQFSQENGFQNVREAVESQSKRLAQMLVRSASGYAFDAVQYSLREIIRNVFEHAGSKTVTYCAQYSPSRGRVELSIVDEGQGIHASLVFNPRYKDFTEREALHHCLLPGVSGNYRDLRVTQADQTWRNSGYGLYMASRLCRNQGGFLIISSKHAIQLSKGKKHVLSVQNFRGTMITLNISLANGVDLGEQLRRYAEEGKDFAQNIIGAKVIEASAASQMLLRDFAAKADR